MALFQHHDKLLHYDLHAGLVPEDTLFLHGSWGSTRWWTPTLQSLKARYKMGSWGGGGAVVDGLGCGESSGPRAEKDLDFFSLARDHIDLIKSLGLSDVNLVGHATGGLIALCACLEAPELFRKLVLLDSVAADGVPSGSKMVNLFSPLSRDRDFWATVVTDMIRGSHRQDPLVQTLIEDALGCDEKLGQGLPQALKGIDIRGELKRIELPVLVLHGELDELVPMAGSKAIALGVAHGQFVELKGQGHSCHVENPEKFVGLVSEFLFGP